MGVSCHVLLEQPSWMESRLQMGRLEVTRTSHETRISPLFLVGVVWEPYGGLPASKPPTCSA